MTTYFGKLYLMV